jgi:hypothetical protein
MTASPAGVRGGGTGLVFASMEPAEPLDTIARVTETAIAAHAVARNAPDFRAASARLARLTTDFAGAVRAAFTMATRAPGWREQLFWLGADDFIASAAGIAVLATNGILNPARRELRYMLESAVKYVYVDQQHSPKTPLAIRQAFLAAKVKSSSIDRVATLDTLGLVDADTFRAATWRLWGELSTYVHVSGRQLGEHVDALEAGSHRAFETAAEVELFNDLLERSCDLLLVFIFIALGVESTADLFGVLAGHSGWSFASGPFTTKVQIAVNEAG